MIFAVSATLTMVTFGLLLRRFWITLEHKATASRSWALGARCEDYPSCHAHFARRAGTTRRMGHAHFARWAGTTCRIWHADFVRRAGITRRIGHALFLSSGDYRTTRRIVHAHFAGVGRECRFRVGTGGGQLWPAMWGEHG